MSRPRHPAQGKLVGLDALLLELGDPASRRRSVVLTNGCFDLLHAGHLRLLEQAAALGDLLVVGLNGDGSVRRLKGAGRPVRPFARRALLLAGLEAVGRVVGFDEDTPLRLIERLQPDVLVKGADWAPERIVGRALVERRGGRVVTVPLFPGCSTTRMIARLRAGAGSPDPV